MSGSEGVVDFSEVTGVIRRRKWGFLAVFLIVFLIGTIIAFALPSIFRAETKVLIERQQAPDDLVQTTVTGYVQERLESLKQKVLTDEELLRIVKKFGLPGSELDPEAPDYEVLKTDLVVGMIENTTIETEDVQVEKQSSGRSTSLMSIAFTVSYEDENPQVAMDVANEITNLILEGNFAQRTEQAKKVTDFLAKAGNKIKSEIAEIEKELTKLKGQNYDTLPDNIAETREDLAQREDDLLKMQSEVAFLEKRRTQILAQMRQTSRHALNGDSDVGVLLDPKLQLAKAKIDLRNAREEYTENHPDVLRLKEQIQDLEQQVAQGGSAEEGLSVPTNPAYIRLQEQLDETDAKLGAAESSLSQVQQVITRLTKKSITDPAIEIKYNDLIRRLDRAQTRYADIKDRSYKAELAQSLETEQQGDRFTLMKPATKPRLPVKPNRIGIVMLSVFFAFFVATAHTVIRERSDTAIRTSKDVKKIFGAEPIGVIPVIR